MAATTTAVAADYTALVQSIYISYFGRPADTVGLANYTAQLAALNAPLTMKGLLESTSASIKTLVNSFGSSAESVALYGTDTIAFVKAIYVNVLNRAADFDGLVYWATEIDAGRLTKSAAALNIAQGAMVNTTDQGKIDAATLANKIVIATNFTKDINTPEELSAYSGAAAAAIARDMLKTVTNTTVAADFQATVTATVANLVTAAAPVIPVVVGQTFTLTTSATDISNGTTGNDTFVGQVGQSTTLQASDSINGKGGADTLRIVTDVAAVGATPTIANVSGFTVTGVATLEVQAQATGGSNIGLENVTGLTAIRSSSSNYNLTFDQVKNIVDLSISNSLTPVGGVAPTLTVNYQAAAVAGTADTQKLALNGNSMGVVTVNGIETLAITSATAASILAGVTGGAALTKITAAGDQLVTLTNAQAATVKTIDSSAQTAGGLVVTLTNAQDVAVTGGAGADKATFTGAFTSLDSFNGGAGRDTIVANMAEFTATVNSVTYAAAAKISNVEIIEFANQLSADFDASKIAGEDTYTLTAGFATSTLSGVTTGTTLNLNATSVGQTLTVPTATSLNLVINSAATVTEGIGNVGTIVAAAATTLTVASNGVNTATDGTKTVTNTLALTAAAATKVTVTGAEDLTLTVTSATLKELDAGATTGANNFSGVTFASGATITGGTGIDTVVGSAGADVITTKAGADIITGAGGADTITGGDGIDTFTYTALADSTGTTIDTITDFVTGVDKFSFTAAAAAAGRTTITLKGGAAATFGAAQAALTLNSGVTQVVYQVDTNTLWVDLNDDGTLNANDLQIKLTGVTAVTSTDVGAVVGAASTALIATAGVDVYNATTTTQGTAPSVAAPLSGSFGGVAVGTAPTANLASSISTTAANLTVLDTFAFGTGTTDTLTFTDAVTGLVINANTINAANVRGVDVIQLANTVNSVTYTAQSTAAETLKGGSAQDVISVATGLGVTNIQTGAGNDAVAYAGTAAAATLDLGAGTDSVTFAAVTDVAAMATLAGGADSDTITVTAAAAFVDTDFTTVTGFENVNFGNAGTNTITLDGLAFAAGVKKVSDTQNGTNTTTIGVTYGALAAAGSISVVGGTGADTVSVTSSTNLGKIGSFAGGTGADVLVIAAADLNLVDSMFAPLTSVETLSLTGASKVILGSAATTAGITTVIAGAAATTVTSTQTAITVNGATNAMTTLTTGAATANYTVTTNAALTTITATGSSGTMNITSADLTGNALALVLGSGSATVSGGGATDTVTVTGLSTAGQNFTGTAASIFNVTATAGVHAITTGAAKDIIAMGAGGGTVISGGAADSVTGGAGVDVHKWSGTTAAALATEAGTTAGDSTVLFVAATTGDKIASFTTGTDKLHFPAAALINVLGTEVDTLQVVTAGGTVTNTARFVDSTTALADFASATILAHLTGLNTAAIAIGDSFIIALHTATDTQLYYIKQVSAADTIAAQDVTLLAQLTGVTALTAGDFVSY